MKEKGSVRYVSPKLWALILKTKRDLEIDQKIKYGKIIKKVSYTMACDIIVRRLEE